MNDEVLKSATFSPCRRYRYSLWRQWQKEHGHAMFIGLNPSTADETNDDPTVRRCINFARSWGYGGLCMMNIFAFRATYPHDMMKEADPVGPDNDGLLIKLAAGAGVVVAAWGVHGKHNGRGDQVRKMLGNLHYLRMTKDGNPGHPLYLPSKLKPIAWGAP